MRLFIAIDLPGKVKERLSELQQPIGKVKWQDPENAHITLKFLGDVDEEKIPELTDALGNIDHNKFAIELKGLGYFPRNKNPRVLWAGITDNPTLQRLQQKIEKRCSDLGFDTEDRPFHAHVTIGRVKGNRKRDILSFINQHKTFRVENIGIHEFTLFSSRLDSDGAVHTPVEIFPLSGNI